MIRCFSIKYTLIICFSLSLCVFSQDSHSEIENIMLDEVLLESNHSYADSRSYLLLKRRVLKVYPYVDTISRVLGNADNSLQGIRKKDYQDDTQENCKKKSCVVLVIR